MNHRQHNFPAYRAFRVNFHIKIILEEFACVVGDVNSKATVNSVCHLANKKDPTSGRASEYSARWGQAVLAQGWAEPCSPRAAQSASRLAHWKWGSSYR